MYRSTSSNPSSLPEKDDPFRSLTPVIMSREEPARPLFPQEGIGRAVAIYDFKAVESGDLSFSKGDVIIITRKSDSSNDWWTGKIRGRQGIFPANFVELV